MTAAVLQAFGSLGILALIITSGFAIIRRECVPAVGSIGPALALLSTVGCVFVPMACIEPEPHTTLQPATNAHVCLPVCPSV